MSSQSPPRQRHLYHPPAHRSATYIILQPTAAPPISSSSRPQRHLLETLLQHFTHVRPDLVGLTARELLQDAELAVEVDDGPRRRLIHLETLPDRLGGVVMPLDQPLSGDVIGELQTHREWRGSGHHGRRNLGTGNAPSLVHISARDVSQKLRYFSVFFLDMYKKFALYNISKTNCPKSEEKIMRLRGFGCLNPSTRPKLRGDALACHVTTHQYPNIGHFRWG